MSAVEPIVTPTDRDLAARVAGAGDEDAFRSLFDRHTPRLLRFVLRLTPDGGRPGGIAEDLVQETWVRAVEGLDRFGWRSSFATWLQGIALNVTREALRRRAGVAAVDAAEREAAGEPASDSAGRIDLERALARLPDGRRTVLVLHDLYGYTHAEIAEALTIAVGTSKSQLHEARRELEIILTGGVRDGRKRA